LCVSSQERGLKHDRCRESCRATLSNSNNEYSISGPSISGSLSFSAVSAMLNMNINVNVRESDDYFLNTSNSLQAQGQGQGVDANDIHVHAGVTDQNDHVAQDKIQSQSSDDFLNGDEFIRSISVSTSTAISTVTRPHRLPPLIEDLVGTIDSDFTDDASSKMTEKQGQRKLLRTVRNDRDDRNRLGKITKRGLKNITVGEDSVAMVAAAAAAAVWSETESERESFRMKTINNEWEASLRWISSWGQNIQSTSTKGSTQDIVNDMQSRGMERNQRRKRNSNPNVGHKIRSERFSAENEIDFELLLDVCIDRCIRDDGDDRANTNHEGGLMAKKLDLKTTLGINQFFSSIKSIVQTLRSTKRMIRSQSYQQTFRGMFGFMLSTAVIWFIRNFNDWRKINKYTNSLRSLIEEETREANMNYNSAKHQNTSSKKPGSKKARRKRRDNRNHQKDREITIRTSVHDNTSEASEDSFERRYIEEEYHRKNSEDQASKEGNTTVSSCTTDGADFEYQMMSTDATIMKLKAANRDTNNMKSQPSTKKQEDDTSFHYKNPTKGGRKARHLQPKKTNFPKVHSETRVSKQKHHGLLGHQNMLVPTAEQREEASRQLREFQQAQIQKIINYKQRQKASANELKGLSSAKQITLRDLAQATTSQPVENINSEMKVKNIRPPPGLTRVTKDVNDSLEKEESDHEADVGYLLSHLLDEEDEEPINHVSKEITPDRYSLKSNEQTRSIALGDLLVGAYLGSSSSNIKSLSSNPWKDESVGGSTVETYLSSPSHSATRNVTSIPSASNDMHCSTDANICLQVSAIAFSPSMKSDTIGEERIW
jgi:hypothetical protein